MTVLKGMVSGIGGPGCAIIMGTIVLVVTSLIVPGGPFIDNVDQTEFPEAIEALADNANLTHVITLLGILGAILVSFGLFSFFGLSGDTGSTTHAWLRFGLVLNLFHYAIFILASGLRHFLLIVEDGGVGTGGENEAVALGLHAAGIGLHFAFLTVSAVASMALGVGLARRFGSLNVYAAFCWLLVLAGVLGLVNVIVGEHFGDDLEVVAWISNIGILIAAVCLIVIGYGVHTGQSELVADNS